jgi:hypothetical protein
MQNPGVPSSPLEFRLTGSFDLPAARQLCDDLIAAGRGRLVVDVSHARELHDDALALLSRAMCLLGARVSMRGLTQHHLKVLRYLGAPVLDGTSFDASGDDAAAVAPARH